MTHRFFREDRCTFCGECLVRCPYLNLTRGQAIEQMKSLVRGGPAAKVLAGCASCYSCNVFCPEDAHPYELILERWDRRYRERGLPARAPYLLPYHYPNYRGDVERLMDARERSLLASWKNAPAQGEVLYPGCNLLTVPYLFDLKVLERLPVSGDWSLCCGEPFYRLGLFGVMERIAGGLTAYYAEQKVERMVFVCPACLNMFQNVLPTQFGARFDFECEYLGTWLLRKLDAGELEIRRPLEREVTIHDSCHGRVLGPEVMDGNRELLRRLGLSVINMKRHHQDGLCCGIAAACNRQLPQDIMKVAWRELREGVATGAPEMAIYCTGCYLMLNLARHATRTGQALVHTLEYLAEATQGRLPRTVEPRTRRMLMTVVQKSLPVIFSNQRYQIGPLDVGGRLF